MKKILILSIILLLSFSMAGAVMWDIQEIMTGKQMVPDDNNGAPWFADSSKLYFGTGQDAYWMYNPAMDKIYLNDTAVYLEEDVTVGGILTATGGTVNGGVYDGNMRFAANHSVYSTAGSGGIDWSNATGAWKMPTGQGTIGGLLDINAATTARNITLDANYNIVQSGTGTISGSASASSGDLISTDDTFVTDDLNVDGKGRIDETLTANAIVSNTTITSTGTSTASTFLGNVKIPDFFSIGSGRIVDTNYTYPTGGKMDSIVMVDARSYNSTLTLLPAASAPGNLTIIKLQYAPGAYFARINVTADEHINGKHLVYTTDDSSTFLPSLTLWSSGTSWYVINVYGTWTSADV
jgi:hypothetical protein